MIDIRTQFGLVGDGTTDDTDAFEAALTSSHKRLFLRDGVYRITRRLVSALACRTIEGESPDAVIYQSVSGLGALLITASGHNLRNFALSGSGPVAPDPEDEEDVFQDGPGVGLQWNERPSYINDLSAERLLIRQFSVGMLNVDADASSIRKCSFGPNGTNLVVGGNQDAMIVDNCTSGAALRANCEVRTNGAAEIRCGVWNANPAVNGPAFRILPGGELTLAGTHIEGLSPDEETEGFVNLAVDAGHNSILHCYSVRIRDRHPEQVHITGGNGFRARLYATDANAEGVSGADIRAFGCRVPLTWNGMKTHADGCLTVGNDPSNIPAPSVAHAGQRIRILSSIGEDVAERVIECRKIGAVSGADTYDWKDI